MLTVYSMPGCSHCDDLKDYLNANAIDYISVDCSEDQEKAKAIVEKTQQYEVPITVYKEGTDEEKYLIGFQEDSFKGFLTVCKGMIY